MNYERASKANQTTNRISYISIALKFYGQNFFLVEILAVSGAAAARL